MGRGGAVAVGAHPLAVPADEVPTLHVLAAGDDERVGAAALDGGVPRGGGEVRAPCHCSSGNEAVSRP